MLVSIRMWNIKNSILKQNRPARLSFEQEFKKFLQLNPLRLREMKKCRMNFLNPFKSVFQTYFLFKYTLLLLSTQNKIAFKMLLKSCNL